MSQSFSVVAVIKEDAEILRKFYRYYVGQGASLVRIYFDGNSPIAAEDLPDKVEIIEVDGALKDEIPGRAENNHVALQNHVYTKEHAMCETDWMLVVDADEYVTADKPLAELFANLPVDLQSLRFPSGEAVWRDGDGIDAAFGATCFRKPLGKYAHQIVSRLLYGEKFGLYRRGLLGHCSGKHAIRRETKAPELGIHFTEIEGEVLGKWSHEIGQGDAFVAHFDAIDRNHWVNKFYSRALDPEKNFGMSQSRKRQVELVKQHFDAGTTDQIFRELFGLRNWQHSVLKMLGAVHDRPALTQYIKEL